MMLRAAATRVTTATDEPEVALEVLGAAYRREAPFVVDRLLP